MVVTVSNRGHATQVLPGLLMEKHVQRHGSADITSRLLALWVEYSAGTRSVGSLPSAGRRRLICPRAEE